MEAWKKSEHVLTELSWPVAQFLKEGVCVHPGPKEPPLAAVNFKLLEQLRILRIVTGSDLLKKLIRAVALNPVYENHHRKQTALEVKKIKSTCCFFAGFFYKVRYCRFTQ